MCQKLAELVHDWEMMATSFLSAGAADHEPRSLFQQILRRAWKGKEVSVPTTAEGWKLYTDSKSAPLAAANLAHKTRRCVRLIEELRPHDREAGIFIQQYCRSSHECTEPGPLVHG